MLFESICAQCHAFGFKSTLLRQSHTTCHTIDVAQAHRRKNRENHYFSAQPFFLARVASGVFPRMMSLVAKQQVMMSWLVAGSLLTATSHDSSTKAQSAKTSVEGF
jgi:hypothetical protein